MTRPLELIIDFATYEGTQSNNPADVTKVKNRIQEDSVSGVVRLQKSIATGTVDEIIPLPDPTSEYLLILVDQEVTVKVNSSTDELTLKPRAAGIRTLVWFYKGVLSALTLSNNSGSSVNVDIISVNK